MGFGNKEIKLEIRLEVEVAVASETCSGVTAIMWAMWESSHSFMKEIHDVWWQPGDWNLVYRIMVARGRNGKDLNNSVLGLERSAGW